MLRRATIAARVTLAIGCGVGLGGCVETGDFGRVKQRSVWNEAIAATGSVAALGRREPVSSLLLTDDEQILRDRAWRFLVPAHERAWFDRVLAELVATRILPAAASQPDRAAYHDALIGSAVASPAPLYRRLSEDIAADMRLLPVFAQTASRVLNADRIRLRVLGRIEAPTPVEIAEAEARVTENRCLISWVIAAMDFRTASYTYALERLTIGSPQPDSVPVERVLERFSATRIGLRGLGIGSIPIACAPDPALSFPGPAVVGPLVVKG